MSSSSTPLPFIGAPRSRFSIWLAAIRPKTLFAAGAPVIVGTALAINDGMFHLVAAACALISALMIQIGTNLYNDFADAKKGADTDDRIGPLRVTHAGLVSPRDILLATVLAFLLAVASGAFLMYRGGLPIILVGICSIVFGFLYSGSRFSLAALGVADIFVLVFFGPVAVGGTYFVQALSLPTSVVVAGLAPGLLATAILLVNNVRDIAQDREAGKRTLVVRFGRTFGVLLYAVCLTLGGLIPVALIAAYGYTPFVLIASVILVPAFPMVDRLASNFDGPVLNALLGATGMVLMLYSVLFSIGLLAG